MTARRIDDETLEKIAGGRRPPPPQKDPVGGSNPDCVECRQRPEVLGTEDDDTLQMPTQSASP